MKRRCYKCKRFMKHLGNEKFSCTKCKTTIQPYIPIPKEQHSKNQQAAEVMGMRKGGIPLMLPCELDYHCPICGEPPYLDKKGEIHWSENFHFSEYRGFMWCPHCNLDIPSFLCLRADSRRAVEIYTERYLGMIKEIKNERREGGK